MVAAHRLAPFLGIELRGDPGGPDQVAEQHRQMTPLAGHFRGWTGDGWDSKVWTDALSAAPQSPQKVASGALSAPHCGQLRGSGAPHAEQNLLPAGLSEPQLEQRMALPENRADNSCITHHGEKTHRIFRNFHFVRCLCWRVMQDLLPLFRPACIREASRCPARDRFCLSRETHPGATFLAASIDTLPLSRRHRNLLPLRAAYLVGDGTRDPARRRAAKQPARQVSSLRQEQPIVVVGMCWYGRLGFGAP